MINEHLIGMYRMRKVQSKTVSDHIVKHKENNSIIIPLHVTVLSRLGGEMGHG